MINILNYYEFINDGLIKTNTYDDVLNNIDTLPNHLIYNIDHKSNGTIYFEIEYFNKLADIYNTFEAIESYFINIMGWFPSKMIIENVSGMVNKFEYNRIFLIDNQQFYSKVQIIFESKFDVAQQISEILYHLSLKQFHYKIMKDGLVPKSKSKLTTHGSRIYVCRNIIDCENLIPNMRTYYNQQKWSNPKLNIDYSKWNIYQIDTTGLDLKMYKDPNYSNGFYLLRNIPPENMKVIKQI